MSLAHYLSRVRSNDLLGGVTTTYQLFSQWNYVFRQGGDTNHNGRADIAKLVALTRT
jgi:hypothetical protein